MNHTSFWRSNRSVFLTFCAAGASLLHLSPPAMAQSDRVVIEAQPGYAIAWDGNNGAFSDPEPGAMAPENAALAANGSIAFASSAFIPGGVHDSPNVIDGFYGNSSSWISDFALPDADPFLGIAFGRSVAISSIAWSRDNGDDAERTPAGPYTDRAAGVYTLQITTVESPGVDTPDTDAASSGWETIGTIQYSAGADNIAFSAYLRHRFDISAGGQPVNATGVRIKVSDPNIAIDEIEVNPPADPTPPLSSLISVTAAAGFTLNWNGDNGKFSSPEAGAAAPKNRALASEGTIAFGSSEFGSGVHLITNVNDGLYGNSHSWIANFTTPDAAPFIGLNFGGAVDLKTVAWSRDNGDDTERDPAGPYTDRALGTYTIQYTAVAAPSAETSETEDAATGWMTIGTVQYKGEGTAFAPYLRHAFTVARGGAPVTATGVRIKVSDPAMAIDEIEVNPLAALQAIADGLIVISPQTGYSLEWDGNEGEFFGPGAAAAAPANDALASNGSTAFGSGQLFADNSIHDIDNVIDGFYGNSRSWIPGDQMVDPEVDPGAGPFVGVRFNRTVPISSVAWGRDNGNNVEGQIADRWLGIYTLQITRVSDPGPGTPETEDAGTGWSTLGTVDYTGQNPPDFNPWLRHRFEVKTADGSPVQATALRIKVSDPAIDIDEIEVNPSNLPPAPIVITSRGAYSITWDGNDGLFSDTNSPARAPLNAALASNGTTAFGSSEFGGGGAHLISNVNDGLYGNSHSWIPNFAATPPDASPYIGLNFGKSINIRSIAWGRDNGDDGERTPPGPYTDRAAGLYEIQVTSIPNPGTSTTETGDPATGWATIGTIDYRSESILFHAALRHRYDVSLNEAPISATGLRIKVPNADIAIDEIEVNPQENISIAPAEGYSISWDGNDGDFFSEAEGAAPPDNDALASKGVIPFGSTELDLGIHLIAHINDGLYGNSHSWISDQGIGAGTDTDPFVGLNFGKTLAIHNIAWSRDNGDTVETACGGTCADRSLGTYTLQVTLLPDPGVDTPDTGDPATGWVTIGTITYRGADGGFRPSMRHRFSVGTAGSAPIQATGFRLKAPDGNTAIDEIEINTAEPEPAFEVTISRDGGSVVLSWPGAGTLQSAASILGPWNDVPGASPQNIPVSESPVRFFRVQQ